MVSSYPASRADASVGAALTPRPGDVRYAIDGRMRSPEREERIMAGQRRLAARAVGLALRAVRFTDPAAA